MLVVGGTADAGARVITPAREGGVTSQLSIVGREKRL